MKSHIIYTSSFEYPASLLIKPPMSSLVEGEKGVFAVSICPEPDVFDAEHEDLFIYLLEINLSTERVLLYNTSILAVALHRMQVMYDNVWVISMETGVRASFDDRIREGITIYEVTGAITKLWQPLLRLEAPHGRGTDVGVLALWQRDQSCTMLFAEYFADGLTASHLYIRQFHSHTTESQPEERKIGQAFVAVPHVFDKTFLLFLLDYQRKTNQWCFRIAAHTQDGTRLDHILVPNVSLPGLHEFVYVANDLWDWLWPTLFVIDGPSSIDGSGGRTCVAALVLHVQPEKSHKWKEGKLHIPEGLSRAQGGLYWIDYRGHILKHEASPLGTQIRFCLCGERIVGSDFLDDQWRLWSWLPAKEEGRTIHTYFTSNAKQMVIVASDDQQSLFWCIEEYTHAVRVSLWESEHFREIQSCWHNGVSLAYHASGPGPQMEPCVRAYQKTLLLVGLNQERQFQVMSFKQEEETK